MFSFSRADFGDNFVFGVATAAYQIEGGQTDGRGSCIWDTFGATPGNVVNCETGKIACDHYNRWPEDLDLIRDGGFDAYRFSFSWPRLIPEGTGAINQPGIDFYDRLIDGMLERGIKPFATLYHWDLPSPLQDRGGWTNRDIVGWFTDYALLVEKHFGDRLATIGTINEPWCVAFLSYFLGEQAPGLRDVRAGARAMHHVLLAHGTATKALRAEGADNIGIVFNYGHTMPASDSDADQKATRLWDGVLNRWYLDGVLKGSYPEDVLAILGPYMPKGFENDMSTVGTGIDWLGINYYSRNLMAADPTRAIFPVKSVEGPLEKTEMGWEIFPEGLTSLLVRIATDYPKTPLYVTENGMAEIEGIDDPRRTAYYDAHLKAVLDAMHKGVDMRGYIAWSLLDNYEWSHGYSKRFGLVHVDYETQKRTPKASYRAFQGLLHNSR